MQNAECILSCHASSHPSHLRLELDTSCGWVADAHELTLLVLLPTASLSFALHFTARKPGGWMLRLVL